MRADFRPYEGKEPYIFISYAHRDSDRVFPIIRRLQEDFCRVWYDDGIDPGTEFEDLPDDFECPLCGAGKEDFEEETSERI